MFRRCSLTVARASRSYLTLCQVPRQCPLGKLVNLPHENYWLRHFGDNDKSLVRGFHKNMCNYNTNDSCANNNNNCKQEEEEECTITPCCRPFRLQKEHPMKKKKDDACGKAGKIEKDKKQGTKGKS